MSVAVEKCAARIEACLGARLVRRESQ
ncbi:MAG: hypothetical protein RLZZ200_2260, partial [Pseudomonadota bacterium]